MRKLFFIAMLTGCIVRLSAQEKSNEYKLVWADEFNKQGVPDTANWNYEYGFVRNEELQWYQPSNASCLKGLKPLPSLLTSESTVTLLSKTSSTYNAIKSSVQSIRHT